MRIVVGKYYMVKDQDGIERPARVTTASVSVDEKLAYCGVSFADGRSGVWRVPLSDEEVRAWKRHPDTFFGVLSQRRTQADSPLELYDFFHESLKLCSRDDLLRVLVGEPDFEGLTQLDRDQLASIRAERLTCGALSMPGALPSSKGTPAVD